MKYFHSLKNGLSLLPNRLVPDFTFLHLGVKYVFKSVLDGGNDGKNFNFDEEKLQILMEEFKNEKSVRLLLNAIKSTI